MAQIVTITNPLTGQPAQVDQLEHTAQEIDDAIARALPGGAIDITLQNKVEIELLWENAAPTSSFAGQTISLDLSEYNFVLVEILQTISGDLQPGAIVPVTNLVNREVITNHLVNLGRMATRGFAASTSAVKFSDCKYFTSPYTSVGGTENAYSIPWRVYGIKA